MKRRTFLQATAVAIAASHAKPSLGAEFVTTETTQTRPDGFFTLGRRGDQWALLDPQRRPFFSVGLNHIDPASLRYPENLHLWHDKYGNSMRRWLTESVRPNLLDWGFTCVGAHLCGAYGRNRVRRRGLIDENDVVDTEMVKIIREANQQAVQWDAN